MFSCMHFELVLLVSCSEKDKYLQEKPIPLELNFAYLMSEMEKYVWKANEKLKGLQFMFLTREIKDRFPFGAKQILRRSSKLEERQFKSYFQNERILWIPQYIYKNKL